MDSSVVCHRGRRFKRASAKTERRKKTLPGSPLPSPTPPTGKGRDFVDASLSFPHQRFKPLPSIGSRDELVETDSVRTPSHMASDTRSHDLSVHPFPPEPSLGTPCCVTLCVRLPDGSRTQRRFDHSAHTLYTLLLFAIHSLSDEVDVTCLSNVELASCTVPKVVYSDLKLTLAQAGLTQNTLLCLSIL